MLEPKGCFCFSHTTEFCTSSISGDVVTLGFASRTLGHVGEFVFTIGIEVVSSFDVDVVGVSLLAEPTDVLSFRFSFRGTTSQKGGGGNGRSDEGAEGVGKSHCFGVSG